MEMHENIRNSIRSVCYAIFLISVLNGSVLSQHRGDNLSFQGWSEESNNGVQSVAMGRAVTSISGDVNALFWNPAGLIGIKGPQFSISGNTYNKIWRENQYYRPNRQFVNMSFYLDGLYTPDPANNGIWDNEIFFDTSQAYIVNDPKLGLDEYGEEAADWQVENNGTVFNNISGAYPFIIAEQSFVISSAYATQNTILDYDRNITYLNPHIGSDEYGAVIERITSAEDSVRVNWSDFNRVREGNLNNITIGLGYEVNENIKVGLGLNLLSSKLDESQQITQIGYFDLVGGPNRFKFTYDSIDVNTKGTSDFSATKFNIGSIFNISAFSIGINLVLPYTVSREWSNTSTTIDSGSTFNTSSSGKDELSIPFSYAIGISFKPVDEVTFAFDLRKNNFSKAEFSFAIADSTHRGWADQTVLGFGVNYKALDFLSFLAGYRYMTEYFVPDGAGIKDSGPGTNVYSLGLSATFLIGRFDFAYEYRFMKYNDIYYSNTNFSYESLSNFYFGYTITL